jgi:MFS family permease
MNGARLQWRRLVPLSATVLVAFGAMLYGFSVYLTDEAAGGEFSTTVLSVAYGGAVVAGGLLAFPVGRYADRHGVRAIFGLGALLGGGGLVAFAAAGESWQVVAAWWLLLGPAGAMTYYEPAYIAVDQWFDVAVRPRALAVLTFIGGLAGIIFIPGTERLVDWLGWRPAARWIGLLFFVTAAATAAFALPGPAARPRPQVDVPFSIRGLFRQRRFLVYTAGMAFSFMAAQAILSHRVARFEEAGFAVATVAVWAAVASALSLPGRAVAPFLAQRFGATRVQALVTLLLAAATVLMVSGRTGWEMAGHFAVFGLAFGAVLPLRAMAMAGWYSGPEYGRTMGVQWTLATLLGATGPALAGVFRDVAGGYGVPIVAVAGVFAVAAVLTEASGR